MEQNSLSCEGACIKSGSLREGQRQFTKAKVKCCTQEPVTNATVGKWTSTRRNHKTKKGNPGALQEPWALSVARGAACYIEWD